MDFPIGIKELCKIFNKKKKRTIQAHCNKIGLKKLNGYSGFIVRNKYEFNRLKTSLENAHPGRPCKKQ